jgi:UDP-glucose 4-epimerase
LATYLVTGGAGFIGSHLARALVQRGERVRILDNCATGATDRVADIIHDLEWIDGDLRDAETVRRACQGIEVVLHQGAMASVPRSIAEPEMTNAVNVTGTLNVLLAARDAGTRRVVFASSSSVYGDTPTLPKVEAMTPQPMSPYAVQKLAAEWYCRIFHTIYGLETVALRYFNVFGPAQDPNSQYAAVIPRFIMAVLAGERPVIFGDGEQTRDFTHIRNVVQANLLAARAPAAPGQVMNVGVFQRISLNQVIGLLSELVGHPIEPIYEPARAGDVHDSLADITRAREVLGYEPSVTFAEGLAETVRYYQTSAGLTPQPPLHADA